MASKLVEKELNRCRALLSEERVRAPLEEGKPEQDPGSLGAKAGIGFRAEPGVTVSVYVFEDWSRHPAAVEKLRQGMPEEGVLVKHATNGPLLFFGHAPSDGPDARAAKYRLSDMVSAFSGNE